MTFAERGEAYREAWRSLSQRENAKIIYYTHFQRHRQKLFAVICSLLQSFAFRRGAKNTCITFALSIDDNASFGCSR